MSQSTPAAVQSREDVVGHGPFPKIEHHATEPSLQPHSQKVKKVKRSSSLTSFKRSHKNRSAAQKTSDAQAAATHLVIFAHGLNGSPEDFKNLLALLQEKAKEQQLSLHAVQCNSGFRKTHDGVRKGGVRVAQEVLEVVERHQSLRAISFIGHSLGGLYNRYAIGWLHKQDLFSRLTPMNFITLATPHLGSRRPPRTPFNQVASWVTSNFFSATGKQLMLEDKTKKTKLPLLHKMADPTKKYYKALALFRHRKAYANVVADLTVPFSTAAITPRNPFLGNLKHVKTFERYPHVVDTEATDMSKLAKPCLKKKKHKSKTKSTGSQLSAKLGEGIDGDEIERVAHVESTHVETESCSEQEPAQHGDGSATEHCSVDAKPVECSDIQTDRSPSNSVSSASSDSLESSRSSHNPTEDSSSDTMEEKSPDSAACDGDTTLVEQALSARCSLCGARVYLADITEHSLSCETKLNLDAGDLFDTAVREMMGWFSASANSDVASADVEKPLYSADKKAEFLREMLSNLQKLEWERIPVKFGNLNMFSPRVDSRQAAL